MRIYSVFRNFVFREENLLFLAFSTHQKCLNHCPVYTRFGWVAPLHSAFLSTRQFHIVSLLAYSVLGQFLSILQKCFSLIFSYK